MRHNKVLFVLIALLLALATVQPGLARGNEAPILGAD